MSDLPGALASILSALTTLPVWLLLGLAIVGWVIIFAPTLGNIDMGAFRHEWGPWVWIGAIAFSILFVARAAEACVWAYWSHREIVAGRRVLRFVPLQQQSWWHLAKQQDDSYISQIKTDIHISNISDRPIEIVNVHLFRPRTEIVRAVALVPGRVSPNGRAYYDVPARGTVRASIHIMARGSLAHQGTPLSITVKLTDQYGEEYAVRLLKIHTDDPPARKPDVWQRVKSGFKLPIAGHRKIAAPERPIMPWVYDPSPDHVALAEAILKEEKRSYAANGRIRGGLGSLNVGLQSEPITARLLTGTSRSFSGMTARPRRYPLPTGSAHCPA